MEYIKEIRALRRMKKESKPKVAKKLEKTILALSQEEIETLRKLINDAK
jgi:hypothetical protein